MSKIHVICNDGSPLGVCIKDLWGEGNRGIGIGGSEYALLTMCEAWHNAGHEVVLYNNPITPNGSPFEQRRIAEYNPNEDRDILIVFRSPNDKAVVTNNCLKVWWSCDQFTIGDFKKFSGYVDKIVCISSFHAKHFRETYQINNTIVIDLPTRIQDFENLSLEKEPGKLIFTSVPDRGLDMLWRYWVGIKKSNPNAHLTITSDYRLWGVSALNDHHRAKWMYQPDVRFLGAVSRRDLLKEQATAQILAYPCTYDELFCISVAEAQCMGVYPITSNVGALATTTMGTIINANPSNDIASFGKSFIEEITILLHDDELLKKKSNDVMVAARERFSIDRILSEWNNKVFGG